jgi:hypothetical protein
MNNPEKLSTIQWIHKTRDEEEEKTTFFEI